MGRRPAQGQPRAGPPLVSAAVRKANVAQATETCLPTSAGTSLARAVASCWTSWARSDGGGGSRLAFLKRADAAQNLVAACSWGVVTNCKRAGQASSPAEACSRYSPALCLVAGSVFGAYMAAHANRISSTAMDGERCRGMAAIFLGAVLVLISARCVFRVSMRDVWSPPRLPTCQRQIQDGA